MELRDLPPRHDPKGGSPKSPMPIPVSQLEEPLEGNASSLWRTIALLEFAVIASLAGSIWQLGTGNVKEKELEQKIEQFLALHDFVKHSELDQVMATRAPYIHDKPRLDAKLDTLTAADAETRMEIRDLRSDFIKSDDAILKELHELERSYYQDHPLDGKK